MIYKTFDIVIVPFPFVDSVNSKIRPALVLSDVQSNNTGLITLAMITSAQHNKTLHDMVIADLLTTGLSVSSIIRMKIFSLDTHIIHKKIGILGREDQSVCKKLFKQLFNKMYE